MTTLSNTIVSTIWKEACLTDQGKLGPFQAQDIAIKLIQERYNVPFLIAYNAFTDYMNGIER